MEQILKDYSWDLEGHMPRASQAQRQMLTIEDAERAYQLIPSPPKIKGCDVNDYIRLAQETRELKIHLLLSPRKRVVFQCACPRLFEP